MQTSTAIFSDVHTLVEPEFNHPRITQALDHNARLAAISAVDKEVDAAKQHLHSLHARRNSLAPISLLPTEILARVFHFLALDEPPLSTERDSGWMKTTHVCQHWRQVALGDSSLWARIERIDPDVDSALISEMLDRAKNAPLEIDIDVINTISNPMHLFSQHLSHTRALRLHDLGTSDGEGVREIFSREAPALEHFELELVGDYPIAIQDLGGTTTLFKGEAPKLRSFCISQLCVPWSFIPRGQLTQLKITLSSKMFQEDRTWLCNTRQFTDLLVDCPALEILVLENCVPCDFSQSSLDRTVHLPRLSHLCVGDASSSVTDLLKTLRLPSMTMLHLRCVSEYGSSHNNYHLLPVISSHFGASSPPVEFKSLKVDLSHSRNLSIVASTSSIVQSSRVDMDDEGEFVLSFDGFAEEAGHWNEILERACKILPISNLEFLSVSTPDTVGLVNLAELFKHCTNVTTIQAIGRGTSNFIRALTPEDGSGTSAIPAPRPIIFPNLTSLLLDNLDFTEIKPRSGVLYDVIANGLRQRQSTYNAPIKKIRIDRCVITDDRANSLEKHVAEFHWDRGAGLFDAYDECEDFEDYESDSSGPAAEWDDLVVGSEYDDYEFW